MSQTEYHFHGGPLHDNVSLVDTHRDRAADKQRYGDCPPEEVVLPGEGWYRTDGRCCKRSHDAGWWRGQPL